METWEQSLFSRTFIKSFIDNETELSQQDKKPTKLTSQIAETPNHILTSFTSKPSDSLTLYFKFLFTTNSLQPNKNSSQINKNSSKLFQHSNTISIPKHSTRTKTSSIFLKAPLNFLQFKFSSPLQNFSAFSTAFLSTITRLQCKSFLIFRLEKQSKNKKQRENFIREKLPNKRSIKLSKAHFLFKVFCAKIEASELFPTNMCMSKTKVKRAKPAHM
jgi:hypothetical protein